MLFSNIFDILRLIKHLHIRGDLLIKNYITCSNLNVYAEFEKCFFKLNIERDFVKHSDEYLFTKIYKKKAEITVRKIYVEKCLQIFFLIFYRSASEIVMYGAYLNGIHCVKRF